jgi:NAD(P)H-nitrite reductase large subunit
MNLLIVGNSAAGTAAIEAIRRHDGQSSIVQISDEPHSLYSRCLLSYYLAGTIPLDALQYRERDFHTTMRVQLHPGMRAIELDPSRQEVRCDDGKVYPFDKLLIATGSSAKLPENLPTGIEGICVLRTIDDVEMIRKKVKHARNAVVLGGGLIGMKAACALRECGLETKVVVRSNRVLSQMIDEEASQILIERLRQNGIDVLKETDVAGIRTRENALVGVRTDQGQDFPCELLIVAKGVHPNIELIQGTDIKKRWGIETNPHMQTSCGNIFAAGDVAETFDIATGEYAINALWTCAVQQGQIAGLNMIGRTTVYDGTVGMNSLDICNTPVISYGITSPKETSQYQMLVRDRRGSNVYKKIILEDHRIKGIILIGRIDNAGVLLSLLRRQADVSAFEDELLDDQFDFGRLVGHGDPSVIAQY